MMPAMDVLHWPPPRPDRVTLWGGPADGQEWVVVGPGDVRVPLKSQRSADDVLHQADDWRPQMTVAVYRYNTRTNRYEYTGQVKE